MTKQTKRRAGPGRKPKGPISGNSGWLQARITEELSAQLKRAAGENGRSLSQEAQLRLKESFELPAKMRDAWGPPEVRALAQLVSRLARSVQSSVSPNPFEAGELAWHRNAFTHAAVEAAIRIVLARFKPTGPAEIPARVKESRTYLAPDEMTPEGIGRAIAMGMLSQYDIHRKPPEKFSAGAHYGEAYYVFPQLRKDLGEEQ
jgi:hypothetical protein